MRTVIIFSGGLDSTVLLYDAIKQNDEVKALTIDYGQRHIKEVYAAQVIASKLKIEHRTLHIPQLRDFLGRSSQTDPSIDVPEGHYADENMKATIVPNRNMIMMSLAAGWCISLGFDRVGYAAHAGDHAVYPDCRPQFTKALADIYSVIDYKPVGLYVPFLFAFKKDIVSYGAELGAPLGDTWSCYKGGHLHCGKCGTCVERREAFKLAGVPDPTVYQELV